MKFRCSIFFFLMGTFFGLLVAGTIAAAQFRDIAIELNQKELQETKQKLIELRQQYRVFAEYLDGAQKSDRAVSMRVRIGKINKILGE